MTNIYIPFKPVKFFRATQLYSVIVYFIISAQQEPRVVQLMGPPYNGNTYFNAGPAQFGLDLKSQPGVSFELILLLY